MSEMNRNEFFISNILEIIEQLESNKFNDFLKDYILDIELKEVEKNSLYAKCINDLKKIYSSSNEDYKKTAIEICKEYLAYANGEKFNPMIYKNDFRKKKYKQLNLDIEKDKMEKFDYYLKQNKQTKKSVIEKAIDDYISKNEK